jgi:hypothetical protein
MVLCAHDLQRDITYLQLVPPLRNILDPRRVFLVEGQQVEANEPVLTIAAQVEPLLLVVVTSTLEEF